MTGTTSSVGPTEIEIDLETLRAAAHRMDGVARNAASATEHMRGAQITPTSFGLMNVPLGEVATALTRHAADLASGISAVANVISENTATLVSGWQHVEDEASDAARQLAEAIAEASGYGS